MKIKWTKKKKVRKDIRQKMVTEFSCWGKLPLKHLKPDILMVQVMPLKKYLFINN